MYKSLDVSGLNLVKFTRDDISELIEASRESFVPYRNNPQETIAGIFDKISLESDYNSAKAVEIFGFSVDNRPITYILLTTDQKNQKVLVNYLYVDEDFRRIGVATKLIKDTLKSIKEHRLGNLYARTWSSNLAAKNLFKKAGLTRERSTRLSNRVNGDQTIWYFG